MHFRSVLPLLSLSALIFALSAPLSLVSAAPRQKSPASPPTSTAVLQERAIAAVQAGKFAEAETLFKQALSEAEQKQDRAEIGRCLFNYGRFLRDHGRSKEALPLVQRAVEIFHALGNKQGESSALFTLGDIQLNFNAETALVSLRAALKLNQEIGEPSQQIGILLTIGDALKDQSRFEEARATYEQALMVAKIRVKSREQECLQCLVELFSAQGNEAAAIDFYRQAVADYTAKKDWHNAAVVRSHLAWSLCQQADYPAALREADLARQAHHALREPDNEGNALLTTGTVYRRLGEPAMALRIFQEAQQILKQGSDVRFQFNAQGLISNALRDMGKYEQALAGYRKLLQLRQNFPNRNGEAGDYINIGFTLSMMGKPKASLESFQEALRLSRQFHLQQNEMYCLQGMAEPQFALHDYAGAEDSLHQAQTLAERNGLTFYMAEIWHTRGRIREAQGKPDEAEAAYRQAVALTEQERADLSGYFDLQLAKMESTTYGYHHLMHLLLKRGAIEEAFVVAQQTKARTLRGIVQNGRVSLASRLTPSEKKELEQAYTRTQTLNQKMITESVANDVGGKARFAALKQELDSAERDLSRLETSLLSRYDSARRRTSPLTLSLPALANALDDNTALIEYVVMDSRAPGMTLPVHQLTAFVAVKQRGKLVLTAHPLGEDLDTLAAQVKALRLACSDPRKPYRPASHTVYARLMQPFTAAFVGKSRLVICADGFVRDVPFAALSKMEHRKGEFLADRFALSYALSAAHWTETRRTVSKRSTGDASAVLVLASPDFGAPARFGKRPDLPGQRPLWEPTRPLFEPTRPLFEPARPLSEPARDMTESVLHRRLDLPGTRREASAIRRLFPHSMVLTGHAAQESAFKKQARPFRRIHLASHAFVNDAAPMLSSILLAMPNKGSSEDGYLTARELYGMELNADMVVLSACNTARGAQRTGEGLLGLTWALQAAGVPRLTVSQWSVDDAATAQLMTTFYRELKQGQPFDTAMQRAEQRVRQSRRKWSHPYYWSPFVCIGSAR